MKGKEEQEVKELKKSHWKLYVLGPLVAAAGYVVWRFGLSKGQKESIGRSALSALIAVFTTVVNFLAIKLSKEKNPAQQHN